jgi:carbamate kinase
VSLLNNNNKDTKIKRDGSKNCEAKDSLKQAEHKDESKDKLEDIKKEDISNDEASKILEISEDTENVVNTHDKGTQEGLVADHDLQGKHSSLNEAVNMDVEGTGSISNAVNQGTMLQEKKNMIEELKAKLEESQTAFKELKEEMAVSRTERQTNE